MVIDTARPLPGGPLAIDLLNTTWASSDGSVDWLQNDAAVKQFAGEHGHSVDSSDIDDVRSSLIESRELTRRLFRSASSDESLLADLNAVLASAQTVVVSDDAGPTLRVTGDRPHNGLAIEALVNAMELHRDQQHRVRPCDHHSCVLWFLDTSKAGRRRWCSMERCGNRNKAQRHYERQTKTSDAAP